MNTDTLERTLYQAPYDSRKTYEVTKMKGAYYLKEFINGKQFGRGNRLPKYALRNLGFLDMPVIGKNI